MRTRTIGITLKDKVNSPFYSTTNTFLVCDCCGIANPTQAIDYGKDRYYFCGLKCYKNFRGWDDILPANQFILNLMPPRSLEIKETAKYLHITEKEVKEAIRTKELYGEIEEDSLVYFRPNAGIFFVDSQSIGLFAIRHKIKITPMRPDGLYSVPW